jgi:hypothetical protein
MKKLLILVVVFGLAAVVNAGPLPPGSLIFSVNGTAQPAEITLNPSEAIVLDLKLAAGHTTLGYDISYVLSNASAELITVAYQPTYPVGPPLPAMVGPISFPTVFEMGQGVVGQPLPQLVRITGSEFFGTITGPGTLMDGLVLHCLAAGDVLLTVVSNGTTIDGLSVDGVIHSLVIHQAGVPEPMTLTILGLGSLFLARRKK